MRTVEEGLITLTCDHCGAWKKFQSGTGGGSCWFIAERGGKKYHYCSKHCFDMSKEVPDGLKRCVHCNGVIDMFNKSDHPDYCDVCAASIGGHPDDFEEKDDEDD